MGEFAVLAALTARVMIWQGKVIFSMTLIVIGLSELYALFDEIICTQVAIPINGPGFGSVRWNNLFESIYVDPKKNKAKSKYLQLIFLNGKKKLLLQNQHFAIK